MPFSSIRLQALFVLLSLSSCGTGGGGATSKQTAEQSRTAGQESIDETLNAIRVTSYYFDGTVASCSGVVIGRYHALTAAHCLGAGLLRAEIHSQSQVYLVSEVNVHPSYGGASGALEHDIAVLKVTDGITQPAFPLMVSEALAVDTWGELVGVVPSTASETSRRLMVALGEVHTAFIGILGSDAQSVCRGDSGAPLFMSAVHRSDGRFGIVGTVSAGDSAKCGGNQRVLLMNLQDPDNVEFLVNAVPDLALI